MSGQLMAGGVAVAALGQQPPRNPLRMRGSGMSVSGNSNEADFKAEQRALRALGVELANCHLDGYVYKPGRFKEDNKESVRPWEVSVADKLDSMLGPYTPIKCHSPEAWTHQDFLLEIREGIAYCTMNRPEAKNAMNDSLSAGLRDAICILKGRPDIRIAVLTGNGRMFCAGGDPKSFQAAQASAGVIGTGGDGGAEVDPALANLDGQAITGLFDEYMTQSSKRKQEAMAAALARDFYEWATLPQFTLALLNGSAMGGGVGLVCASDMAVGVKGAHVTLSEVKLGVIPAVISPHVIRTIGCANAKRLFVTAENCSMQQAKEYGMVQRIVNNVSEFPAVVKEVAQTMKASAPGSVAAAKRAMLNSLNQPLSESLLGHSAGEYVAARFGDECVAGLAAFGSGRKPTWVESNIDVREAEQQ